MVGAIYLDISQEEIVFSREISKLAPEKMELIRRFV